MTKGAEDFSTAGETNSGPGHGQRNNKHKGSGTFKGECDELKGCVFDGSDVTQADEHSSTLKEITEHVGKTCTHGSDACWTLNNLKVF